MRREQKPMMFKNHVVPDRPAKHRSISRSAFLLWGVSILLPIALPARAADPASIPFSDRTVVTPDGTYKYKVFIPAHLDRSKKPPVIVFLHGSGERGSDNEAQTKNGIRLLIAQNTERFPAVVICPQCVTNGRWTQPDMENMVLKELDQTMAEFNGDPDRVYLTGLSLGGYGTWELAKQHPDRWAALAPVCGGIRFRGQTADPAIPGTMPADPYSAMGAAVAKTPAWIFHGDADGSVPVSESRQLFATLSARKANVRYTEYPGVGHNSWDYAYKEPDLLKWFLEQKRKK